MTMRPKGLREIKTVQGMAGRNRGSSREQAVAELARLEHERARLQRELEVWRQNQQRVEEQLGRVEARLADLRAATAEEPASAPRPPQRRAATRPAPRDDDHDGGWATLSLEY
jgi:seryl-tRNA synthetase